MPDTVLGILLVTSYFYSNPTRQAVFPLVRDKENEHRKNCAKVDHFLPGLVAQPSLTGLGKPRPGVKSPPGPAWRRIHRPTYSLPFVSGPLAAVFDSKALLKLEMFSEE